MEYTFSLPGFEGQQLKLVIGTFKKSPKILVDGMPAPLNPYGNVELHQPDGSQTLARVEVQPGDLPPKLVVDGQPVELVRLSQPADESEPAGWFKWVSSGLPLTLAIVGGLLGGVIGAIAGFINLMIVQSRLSAILKYVLTVLVIVLAFGIYFVAALVVNQVFTGQRTPVPTEFNSVEGGFTVTAPDQLLESDTTEQTEAGEITIHQFTAELGDAAFVVIYADYPDKVVEGQSPESFLDACVNGALSGYTSSEILSQASLTLDGYPGREFLAQFEEEGRTYGIQMRIYLVGNRMYMVMVGAPEKVENSERTSTFFESFRLLGE